MIRYLYDGCFDGFLCAASEAFRAVSAGARLEDVSVSCVEHRVDDLFSANVSVATDPRRARALAARFAAAAGAEEIETLIVSHASNDPRAAQLLLRYIDLTLAAGAPVIDNVSLPDVRMLRLIRDRVTNEIHKFLGFVRFRRVTDILYYAPVKPDADIVGFIGPHFADRFPDQSFLIHDVRRRIGFWRKREAGPAPAVAGKREFHRWGIVDLRDMPPELHEALSQDREPLVAAMWREYFDSIAIQERRNHRLQARLMPRRYWEQLAEVAGRRA